MKRVAFLNLYLAVGLLAGPLTACDDFSESKSASVLRVGVSVLPQKYLIDQISEDSVQVQVLIPAGVDPHTYEPGPEKLRILSDLAVYFRQGLEFETACLRRLRGFNAQMRVVDLGPDTIHLIRDPGDSTGTALKQTVHRVDHTGSHGNAHAHANPHTWLSPRLVRAQSEVILATLSELEPERRSQFVRGHREFRAEIDKVDRYIRRRLAPVRDHLFVVYHPSWEYFARDYGLRMLAVQADGHEPSARDLMELVSQARAAGVKTIFAEPGFDRRSMEVVAQDIGATVEVIDPLAENWAENLCDTADQIAEALEP